MASHNPSSLSRIMSGFDKRHDPGGVKQLQGRARDIAVTLHVPRVSHGLAQCESAMSSVSGPRT